MFLFGWRLHIKCSTCDSLELGYSRWKVLRICGNDCATIPISGDGATIAHNKKSLIQCTQSTSKTVPDGARIAHNKKSNSFNVHNLLPLCTLNELWLLTMCNRSPISRDRYSSTVMEEREIRDRWTTEVLYHSFTMNL